MIVVAHHTTCAYVRSGWYYNSFQYYYLASASRSIKPVARVDGAIQFTNPNRKPVTFFTESHPRRAEILCIWADMLLIIRCSEQNFCSLQSSSARRRSEFL